MKVFGIFAFVATLVLLSGSTFRTYAVTPSTTPQSEGQYLVEFSGNQLPDDLAARIAALGGTVVDTFPELKVVIVANLTETSAATLAAQSNVADVTLDEYATVSGTFRNRVRQSPINLLPGSASQPESALFYPYQWDKRVISADLAWQAGFLGSPDVRVAIIDSGVDPTNPDLAGLVDYGRSTSFCPNDNPLIQQEFPGYPAWTDIYGHGTGVASIVSSNGIFTAGVGSRTSIMAVKAFGLFPCRSSALFRSIIYAANNNADVINISGGFGSFPRAHNAKTYYYWHLAIQYALQKGVSAVVVSAGNEALDLDHDANEVQVFCDTPGVVCVSATGATDSGPEFLGPFENIDSPSFYTNFGSSAIDVAAPGGNGVLDPTGTSLLTAAWIWEACSRTTFTFDTNGNIVPVDYCGGYPVWGTLGTSEAAPQVTGLAALLVSKLGHGKSAQVKAAIENSADDRGKPGMDPYYGHGRINVARALGMP